MKKNRILLFIVWASLFLSGSAQPINFLSKLRVEDSLVLYADGHYGNFFNEKLAYKKQHIMTKQELDSLILLLKDCDKPYEKTIKEDTNTLFIGLIGESGDKRGCFLSEKWCKIVDHNTVQNYKCAPKMRSRIRKYIGYYQKLLSNAVELKRYDYLPLEMSARPLPYVRCGFTGSGHASFLDVTFRVLQDSSDVSSIQYFVRLRKKGIRAFRRDINSLTDESNNTKEYGYSLQFKPSRQIDTYRKNANDEPADSLLHRFIPRWSTMTNSERMRFLDDCYEKELIMEQTGTDSPRRDINPNNLSF